MNLSPKLSVIIPTYNRAALLGKTLESVAAQTFSDYEVIVVDDGSTDRTEEAIERYLNDSPGLEKRLRYFFQENQGKPLALNRGLAEARGEWIAFLDSDDLWLPNKIAEQFKVLQQIAPQSQACFTDARFINNANLHATAFECAGKRFTDRTGVLSDPSELIGKFWVYIQTVLVHSRVLAKVGEFDPRFWIGDDEDFIFRLSLQTSLCYINSPLVLIDRTPQHEERLTELASRRTYEVLQLRQLKLEKWLRLTDRFGGAVQTALRKHLRGTYSEQANWLLVNRKYYEASQAAAMAARTQCRPGILAKWCLTTIAPGLARRAVVRRSRSENKQKMEGASLRGCAEDGGGVPAPEGLQ
jgi:glycosyltransferase involved in cell wall biosynthesis